MNGTGGGALDGDTWPGDGDVVGVLARQDATRARRAYPRTVILGPVFAVVEQAGNQWRVLRTGDSTPQGARDVLGSFLRAEATRVAESLGKEATIERSQLLAAARLLDWERHDELVVAERRFRVARVEEFVRFGPGGPEPPRPTDADPQPCWQGLRGTDPARGFALSCESPGSPGLLADRWDWLPAEGKVPPEVWADARWALVTHPQVALLPARFAVAEIRPTGRWRAITPAAISPQAARDTLAAYLYSTASATAAAGQLELADEYAAAASVLQSRRMVGVAVGDRTFQVIRVKQLTRFGSSGPEPPRKSDFDPDPPAEAAMGAPPPEADASPGAPDSSIA
jgi:Family of unknown function (DUF5954)